QCALLWFGPAGVGIWAANVTARNDRRSLQNSTPEPFVGANSRLKSYLPTEPVLPTTGPLKRHRGFSTCRGAAPARRLNRSPSTTSKPSGVDLRSVREWDGGVPIPVVPRPPQHLD